MERPENVTLKKYDSEDSGCDADESFEVYRGIWDRIKNFSVHVYVLSGSLRDMITKEKEQKRGRNHEVPQLFCVGNSPISKEQ